ncbi:MAG: SagB/ThcOx family dehydrogenase [Trueperaceae bacterium]
MTVPLPPMPEVRAARLSDALRDRRSVRALAPEPLSLHDLAALAWSAQGVTRADGKRTTPSARDARLIRLELAVGAVDGLAVGRYAYRPDAHALHRIATDDLRPRLQESCLGDAAAIATAPAVLILIADTRSAHVHFADQPPAGATATRYALLEAGTLAQSLALMAAASGLGTVLIAGIDGAAAATTLGLDEDRSAVAYLPVGRPREGQGATMRAARP